MHIPLELPKHIFFGPGIRERLFEVIKYHNYKKILFITGQNWFKASGWQQEFATKLNKYTCSFMPCLPGEPDSAGINLLSAYIRKFKPQVIIGIGGGSVIDTAKACAVLANQKHKVEDFLEGIGKGLSLKKPGIPCIAMPTTAGTGAEVTKNAVIKAIPQQVKKSIRSPLLFPEYVIVDPEFTLKLNKITTGITGMDALVQLFEAFVSKKSKPKLKSMIKSAFSLLLKGLEQLALDLNNQEARTDVAYGALISGIALANSGLGAVHGFAASLGGLTTIPHGLICALFFNPVLAANKPVILERSAELMNYHEPEANLEKFFQSFRQRIADLLNAYGLSEEFKKYPVFKDQISLIAANAEGSSMSGNPRVLTQQEKEAIVTKVISS